MSSPPKQSPSKLSTRGGNKEAMLKKEKKDYTQAWHMMTKDLPGERMMLKSHDGQDLDDNSRRAILSNRPQTHGGRNRILMINN